MDCERKQVDHKLKLTHLQDFVDRFWWLNISTFVFEDDANVMRYRRFFENVSLRCANSAFPFIDVYCSTAAVTL